MSRQNIQLEQSEGVYTLTLDRNDRRNTLSESMLRDLQDAITKVGASDARGLVLAADGAVFSAGHDFSDMASRGANEMYDLLRLCTNVMQMLHQIPQVVIAKVHAHAIAAGCQLALSADLAIAADSAGFSLPGGKAGWFCHTPSVAVAQNLSPKRLMFMAMSGEMVFAPEAESWGLINAAVPADQLDGAVDEMLRLTTRGAKSSKAWGKRTLYAHLGHGEDHAYAVASEAMAAASQSPEAQEGITAFLEKRSPNFSS